MRASVCFDFWGDLLLCQNPWYTGGKRDNKMWDLKLEHPFQKVLGMLEEEQH